MYWLFLCLKGFDSVSLGYATMSVFINICPIRNQLDCRKELSANQIKHIFDISIFKYAVLSECILQCIRSWMIQDTKDLGIWNRTGLLSGYWYNDIHESFLVRVLTCWMSLEVYSYHHDMQLWLKITYIYVSYSIEIITLNLGKGF